METKAEDRDTIKGTARTKTSEFAAFHDISAPPVLLKKIEKSELEAMLRNALGHWGKRADIRIKKLAQEADVIIIPLKPERMAKWANKTLDKAGFDQSKRYEKTDFRKAAAFLPAEVPADKRNNICSQIRPAFEQLILKANGITEAGPDKS